MQLHQISPSISLIADLDQHGEVDSFLGQQPTSQTQTQSPFQSTAKESSGVMQGKSQNSPFFTMSSSPSSGHDDFLTPATTTQTQINRDTFPGTQVPTTNLPLQTSATMGSGSQTPPRSSVSPPQSFLPPTTSLPQSLYHPTTNLPQTPPVSLNSLPQSPPRPATSWPQTPPQPVTGWPQTPPQSAASFSQATSSASSASSVSQATGPSSVPNSSLQNASQHNRSLSHQVPSGMPPTPSLTVEPVQPHWFYRKGTSRWVPFSYIDSDTLEQALKTSSAGGDRIVPTDGGRYDVNLDKRLRYPLYWEESVSVVRRCSWFCKGDGESKLVPYMEDMAARLEVMIHVLYLYCIFPALTLLPLKDLVPKDDTTTFFHVQEYS